MKDERNVNISENGIDEFEIIRNEPELLHFLEQNFSNASTTEVETLRNQIGMTSIEGRLTFLSQHQEEIDYSSPFIQVLLGTIPVGRRFEYISSEKRQETLVKIFQANSSLISRYQLPMIPYDELLKRFLRGEGDIYFVRACTEDERLAYLKANETSIDYNNPRVQDLLDSISIERRFSYISSEKRLETLLKIAQANRGLLGIGLRELPHDKLLELYFQDENNFFQMTNKIILQICTVDEKISYLKRNEESIVYNPHILDFLSSIPAYRRFEYISPEKRSETLAKIFRMNNSFLGYGELRELPYDEILGFYLEDGNNAMLSWCTDDEKIAFLKENQSSIDYDDFLFIDLLNSISADRRFEYLSPEKRPETFLRILQTSSDYLLGTKELQELPYDELLKNYLRNGNSALLDICTIDEKLIYLKKNEASIDYSRYYVQSLLSSIPENRRFEYLSPEKRSETFLKILQTSSRTLLGMAELQDIPHDELLKAYLQNGNLSILRICTVDEKLTYLKENETSIDYSSYCMQALLESIPQERRFDYLSLDKRREALLKILEHAHDLLGIDELQDLPHDQLLKVYSQQRYQNPNINILDLCTDDEKLAYLEINHSHLESSKITNIINSLSVEAKIQLLHRSILIQDLGIQIPAERLQILRKIFGDWIIDNIIDTIRSFKLSENMKKLFSLPKEDFNTLMELFRSSKLTNDNVNTVYNAFVQKMFTQNRRDVIEVFPMLKSMIDTKNEPGMNQLLQDVSKRVDEIDFLVDEFLKVKEAEIGLNVQECLSKMGYQVTTSEEVLAVITKICKDMIKGEQTENQDLKMSVVHAFCMYYIKKYREQYMALQNKNSLLTLPIRNKKLSREELMKKVFSSVSSEELFSFYQKLDEKDLEESLLSLLHDENLLREFIAFRKDPSLPLRIDVRKNLRNFNILTKMLYSQGILDSYAKTGEVEFFIPETLGKQALEVLEHLDFDRLFANGEELGMDGEPYTGLLHNSEKLEELKKIFQKYGFLGWDDIFQNLTELAQVADYSTPTVFSALINQFEAVSSEIQTGSSNELLFKTLKTAYMKTVDSRLIKLLGAVDYEFLLRNPTPYPGSLDGKRRLRAAESLVPKMYQREFITIPPTVQEFETSEGKKLRVVVGDTTSMINLTYGERTEACMRLDGADEQLFHIALLNPNGFHIRFEDSLTGKLVSRITGFRNGNSVFCNQLRCSLMPEEYPDEELLEITKLYAQTLLEQTKDSRYPVQNVFIGEGYGIPAQSFVGITEPMDIDFKKDFRVGYFPTDIDECSAMVLATTSSDKEYEPLKLGLERAERYPVLRGPVTIQDVRRLNQLRFIDQKLSGGSLEDVSLQSEEDVSQIITGADWYICIMKDGQILSKILDNLPESKRQMAKEEMRRELQKLRAIENSKVPKDLRGRHPKAR